MAEIIVSIRVEPADAADDLLSFFLLPSWLEFIDGSFFKMEHTGGSAAFVTETSKAAKLTLTHTFISVAHRSLSDGNWQTSCGKLLPVS